MMAYSSESLFLLCLTLSSCFVFATLDFQPSDISAISLDVKNSTLPENLKIFFTILVHNLSSLILGETLQSENKGVNLTPSKLTDLFPSNKFGYKIGRTLNYYKFHFDFATWQEAKEVCESEDAHLAIINSETERDVLVDIWSEARLSTKYGIIKSVTESIYSRSEYRRQFYIFLGFHDMNEEGNFETIFGTPLNFTGFSDWDGYEPNDEYPGEDCGSLHWFSGQLNDIECDAKLRYICEQEYHDSDR